MCPSGWAVLIATFIMIGGPSALVFIFSCHAIGGWYGTFFLGIPYLMSCANTLRILLNVALTDPGIIPKIRSSSINYNRNYSVSYREKDELKVDACKTGAANFFSLAQFKLS